MDIETEIHELKRRVGDLEGAMNVLTGQLRDVQPSLLTLQSQTAQRFDSAETMMGRIVGRLDDVNLQVWSLRDDLPVLVGEAVHEALRKEND